MVFRPDLPVQTLVQPCDRQIPVGLILHQLPQPVVLQPADPVTVEHLVHNLAKKELDDLAKIFDKTTNILDEGVVLHGDGGVLVELVELLLVAHDLLLLLLRTGVANQAGLLCQASSS